jgi:outer membrane protein TolC
MKIFVYVLTIVLISGNLVHSQTQTESDTLIQYGTLQNCIRYALAHQPLLKQSLIDEKIVDREINTKLAEWYPQLNFNANFQHNYDLPVTIIQGSATKAGTINTSGADFTLTQNIFNRDVLLASSTAGDVQEQAKEQTTSNKINAVVNVSKAFYAVLLALQQIEFINEDITRLSVNQKNTTDQYKAGVVDKTDYKRATIALNNAIAEKRQHEEQLKANYAVLKQQMGYPDEESLVVQFDSTRMENDIGLDTTQNVIYQDRIEYQLLQTQKRLQEANLDYYIWSFFPTLSAYGEYNFNFLNDSFSKLYNKNYPNSYVGLELSLPIFQGGKRIQEIEQAKLELLRNKYDFVSLENSINTQYVQAMASYKSNLNNFLELKNNLDLAKDVYNTIQLQYKSGIKTYLELITAELDLRTTEVNYFNALYQVLSSKLDVQKALGTIKF